MDIQEKLNAKCDNIAIYTSGFYADPEDELGTRSKLSETLKSFTMNQHADTPFSLQIMTTNGEINVMPLGLLSLDELKAYETKRREQAGLTTDDDAIPLVVQFALHRSAGIKNKSSAPPKTCLITSTLILRLFGPSLKLIFKPIKHYWLGSNAT